MSVIWTIFEYLWLIGLFATFAAGLLAAVAPKLFIKLNRAASTWVNAPFFNGKSPDQMHNIDHVLYRYHVVVGALMVLAALLMFYLLFFRIEAGVNPSLRDPYAIAEAFWLELSTGIVVTGVCLSTVVGLLAGLMMLTAPDFLKKLDSWCNRWISTQGVSDYIERSVFNLDRWGESHTRIYGLLVLSLSALIVVIAFLPLWFKA